MEFLNIVRQRRSIRKFKSDPVPREKLEYVLESARLAPSWGNSQCWKFIIVSDEVKRRAIATRDWVAEAPVIIVGCAYPHLSGSRFNQQYYMLDMGIAMEHLILAAAEQGLGTCWVVGQLDEEGVKQTLNIPKRIRVIALTPLGYPAEAPGPKNRKSFEEIVSYDSW